MSTGFRRAKIVATLGPARWDPAVYERLVEAGIDAIRINFSHTTHEDAARIVALVRDTVRASGRPVAVVGDLQGPRIRVATWPSRSRSSASKTTALFRKDTMRPRRANPVE